MPSKMVATTGQSLTWDHIENMYMIISSVTSVSIGTKVGYNSPWVVPFKRYVSKLWSAPHPRWLPVKVMMHLISI